MAGCRTESLKCFQGSVQKFPHTDPCAGHPTGGNRITQVVLGAHDGGVFGLCALRDGTLVSGGGRDRRVVVWGSDYSKLQEVEVRRGGGCCEGETPQHTPNTRPCPTMTPSPPPLHPLTHPPCLLRSPRTSALCGQWLRAGEIRCTWEPPATPSCRALSTPGSRCSSRCVSLFCILPSLGSYLFSAPPTLPLFPLPFLLSSRPSPFLWPGKHHRSSFHLLLPHHPTRGLGPPRTPHGPAPNMLPASAAEGHWGPAPAVLLCPSDQGGGRLVNALADCLLVTCPGDCHSQ